MKEIERLQKAFVPASEEFYHHIETTLDHMEELTMKKTSRRVSAVAVVLIILLIAGVALAAAHFGVLDFISYPDQDGNMRFNEALIPHVQPIAQTLDGEAVSVTIHDAICDGTTMTLAWTVQNKLPDRDVFIFWHAAIDNPSYRAGNYTPNEFILEGGQTREGGIFVSLVPFVEGSTLHVDVSFTVLEMEREITFAGDYIQLPYENYLEGESKVDALVRMGYMRQLDTFMLPLELDVTSDITDILTRADKTEVVLEDYRMTLAAIECAPTTLQYTVCFTFESEERMNDFLEERRSMGFWPITGEEDQWFGFAETTFPDAPVEANGEWALYYVCDVTEILRMPDAIDIVPFDILTNEVYHPEERFHVSIPAQ